MTNKQSSPGNERTGAYDIGPMPTDMPYDERLSLSVQRGLRLLRTFSGGSQLLGIAELAELTGLTRPTVHRYAITLVRLGYLEQGDRRKYRLAQGAGEPGVKIVGEIRRALAARGVLEGLRGDIGYTISLGVLDDTRVLYIDRLFGHRHGQHILDRELRAGAHVPAYCTALGKIMLASLSNEERRARVEQTDLVPQGPRSIVSHETLLGELDDIDPSSPLLSDEEFAIGACSVALLLPQAKIELPAAIEATVPSEAYNAAQLLEQLGPKLSDAAQLICDLKPDGHKEE
jgi:IclR family pca regulon transcriptional regulator